MTEYFTRDQAMAAVPGLSLPRLASFHAAGLIAPSSATHGPVLTAADLARLALLCELADHLDLDDDALGVVISLIDQLHDTRQRLFAMAQAMQAEPQDLRQRVGARFLGILAV